MTKTKRICLALAILGPIIAGELCRGQSTFEFANYLPGQLDAPVFDADGNRLYGSNYVAILYGGRTVDSLSPANSGFTAGVMPPVPFEVSIPPFGYFFYAKSFVTIPTAPCGGFAWLQVRAWDTRLGSSYETVAALGLGGYGESKIFRALGGDCTGVVPPQPLYGVESFSLRPAPEPTVLLILLLGLPLLLLRYRRRLR